MLAWNHSSSSYISLESTTQKPPKWLVVRVSVARDGALASTPVHGAGAASDFYGECSGLVSVPKVVSAIDGFNFVLATATAHCYFILP